MPFRSLVLLTPKPGIYVNIALLTLLLTDGLERSRAVQSHRTIQQAPVSLGSGANHPGGGATEERFLVGCVCISYSPNASLMPPQHMLWNAPWGPVTGGR